MAHDLHQSAYGRAWDDSLAVIGNAAGAGLGILISAVLGIGSSFLISVEGNRSQAILAAGLSIVAFLTLGALVYLVFLVAAPLRQRNEALTRADKLEQERVPRIALTPRAGRSEHGSHPHLMWAELDVTNLSTSLPLHDVEVRITDLKDDIQLEYGDRVGPDWNPLQVVWSPTNTVPNQFRLTIPPGETRTALIAYSDDSNGPPAIFASPHAGGRRLTSGVNRMEVSVSSPDSAPCRRVFYIQCHPNYLGRAADGTWYLDGPRATMEMELWEEYEARQAAASPANHEETPDLKMVRRVASSARADVESPTG